MTDLHRTSESTWRRAAHGKHGRSVDVGRQAAPGPVCVEADLHVEVTCASEEDARKWMVAYAQTGFSGGGSVTLTGGPRVKPQEGVKPRRLA